MFVDELTITAQAGNGGHGVVRWLREKWKPLGGPAGGNGGKGGDVYMRAVRDIGLLSKYTGTKVFSAGNGEDGGAKSSFGKNGDDCIIDIPMGSVVTNVATKERYEFFTPGETHKILSGGRGGLGNEHFKSSTNRAPMDATLGKEGERGEFFIEVELVVDAGLIGLPNAGKSSLLNALTNAQSRVGAYPFTTLEPHLGDLFGFILADIPGLIEGASSGKGLGHAFLRHVRRTKMLLHCVASDEKDPLAVYHTVRRELELFDAEITKKTEWVILTKTDLVTTERITELAQLFAAEHITTRAVSVYDLDALKSLSDSLITTLREGEDSATMRSHEREIHPDHRS